MSNLSLIAGLGVAVVLSVAAFVARRRKKVSHDSMDLCLELVFFFAAYKLLKVAAVTLGMPSSYFYLAAFAVSAVALVYRMLRKSAGRLYNGLLLLACMGSAIGIIDAVGLASGRWFMVSASAVVALGSLAFIMTSMHKKKDFGNDTADMVSAVAFMASAVKFWQLTLNVSWLWAVLLAVAVLVASLAVYLVALMRGDR